MLKRPWNVLIALLVHVLPLCDRGMASSTGVPEFRAAGRLDARIQDITMGRDGNSFYYVGYFGPSETDFPEPPGSIDLDPGPEQLTILPQDEVPSIFVAKIDGVFNLEWIKIVPADHQLFDASISASTDGDVVVAGNLFSLQNETIDFGEEGSQYPVTLQGVNQKGFVWKIDSTNGVTRWVRTWNFNPFTVRPMDICVGPGQSIYVLVGLSDDGDLDPGPTVDNVQSIRIGSSIWSGFAENAAIVKFDSEGQYIWGKVFHESVTIGSARLATNANGEAFLAIQFASQIDADPGSGVTRLTPNPPTDFDSAVIKLNSTGEFVWGRTGNIRAVRELCADDAGGVVLIHDYDNITRYLQSGSLAWERNLETTLGGVAAGNSNDFLVTGGILDGREFGTTPGDRARYSGTHAVTISRFTLDAVHLWSAALPLAGILGDSRTNNVDKVFLTSAGEIVASQGLTAPYDTDPSTNGEYVLEPFDHYDQFFVKLGNADDMWLDFDIVTDRWLDGTISFPQRTLENALRALQPNQRLNILLPSGDLQTPETATLSTPTQIRAFGGSIRIGTEVP